MACLTIVKSKLQKKLEAEGWTFLTNIQTGFIDNPRTVDMGGFTLDTETMRETQEYLRNIKKKYKEVREEEAYDINGHLLPPYLRAIYVRSEK